MTHTHNGLNAHVLFAVADALDQEEAFIKAGRSKLYFDMGTYIAVRSGHGCGSTACIAGWVVALFDENGAPREKVLTLAALQKIHNSNSHGIKMHNIHNAAMRTIGLEEHEANMLFSPGCLRAITPKIAAETLRNLALTGEIEWNL
jgi:hypothetical protein